MSLQKVKTISDVLGAGYTTQKQAQKYVKAGRAEWIEAFTIRFRHDHHGCRAALSNAEQADRLRLFEKRRQNSALDEVIERGNRAHVEEARNIPFVGSRKAIARMLGV